MPVINIQVINNDWITGLQSLPDKSVNTCITSPPYWGLRDYGVAGQLGLEPTPEEYVAKMVDGFREVRRVMRDDGTLWLNLGDCYANSNCSTGNNPSNKSTLTTNNGRGPKPGDKYSASNVGQKIIHKHGLKPKDLVGIPWRVAFALQADGWYLRSDIIWSKPNPMPESIKDRPTKAHEYIFLLSKSQKYYYNAEAIKEPANPRSNLNWECNSSCANLVIPGQTAAQHRKIRSGNKERKYGNDFGRPGEERGYAFPWEGTTRNKRTVWTVATKPYTEAHFAVFPGKLIEPCILAGCPVGGTVLDPFARSGTTLEVAARLGRHSIGIELNPEYLPLIEKRVKPYREQTILFA